jgi:hypothetical protein
MNDDAAVVPQSLLDSCHKINVNCTIKLCTTPVNEVYPLPGTSTIAESDRPMQEQIKVLEKVFMVSCLKTTSKYMFKGI